MSIESNATRSRSKSPCKITVTDDENTNQLIHDLVKKRAIVKGRLTRFCNFINNLENETVLSVQSKADLKLRMQSATSLHAEFNSLQSTIEESVLEVDLEEQFNQRDQFDNSYYSVMARAECMLKVDGELSSSKDCSNNSVKLPTISVPTFDGSSEHWLEFRDTFASLVHNSTQISGIQKFHYLKSSLKGSAALVIDSLEFCADNYLVAWELLLNRYNNCGLLVHNHVKALFNIQALTKEDPNLLRNLIDTILKNLRALKILGEPVDNWDTLVIYIVVSKLDKVSEREWEQHKTTILKQSGDSKSKLKVDSLLSFLKDRADMLETLQLSSSSIASIVNTKSRKQSHSHFPKIHCNVSTNKPQKHFNNKSCSFCNKGFHPLYTCQQFLITDLDTKTKHVNENKLCENCLRPGHNVMTCRFGPCRYCNKKHNTVLHKRDDDVVPAVPARVCDDSKQVLSMHSSLSQQLSPANSHIEAGMQLSHTRTVLLSTAMVEVIDVQNKYHLVRALLDSGSERCFISSSLCKLLQVPLLQSTHQISGVGNSITQSTQMCVIEIKSCTNTYTTQIQCIVLPRITYKLPAISKHYSDFKIPEHIQLADPTFYESQDIDILIGADKFWDLLNNGKMRLPNGPFLQNTRLGWIVSGPININNTQCRGSVQCNFSQSIEQNIDVQLRQFWELEETIKPCKTYTDEEQECENIFVSTTMRDKDGRFSVSIPLKSSLHELGESYSQALRRFLALERRLQTNYEYKKLYCEFMNEYIKLGHMTRVDHYGTPNYVIPHHGVLREQSKTSKLRVVFDASAKSGSGKSFNDLQMVGPPIQGDLFEILLRMRQYKFIACADVEKMYRQVLINEDQRDLQLILWRDDSSKPINVYKLNTVSYGTSSAPFLAVRCLKQLSLDCPDPNVKRTIAEDFFVDDMVTGSNDKTELLQLCENVSHTLKAGCFSLRKWIFNFQCNLASDCFNDAKDLNINDTHNCKTLGMSWNFKTDEFYFDTKFESNDIISKRIILSHVSQIFDPLGLLSPVIIVAKVLLQKLWLHKLDWDDALPRDVTAEWNRFVNNLSALKNTRVPRHVIANNPTTLELHIFTDASQTAYGACIYVRSIKDNVASVQLLCSKGKVAPLKPVSIPRLELCGALLGARLYSLVQNSLRCQFDRVIFWSDSTIVLSWLNMLPSLLKTFVQNRVAEIHELTEGKPWLHVSGTNNPADLVSRGVRLPDLITSNLWWSGPPFLRDASFECTNLQSNSHNMTISDLPEVKVNTVHAFSCNGNASIISFARFSRFQRLVRTFVYVLRFLHNIRKSRSDRISGVISVSELRHSEKTLAKLSQLESFHDEYERLSKGLSVKHNPSLQKLNLFIDESKTIRVGGRISLSEEFHYDKRHPILLSPKHPFTNLLFRHKHESLLHVGPRALLYDVREQWWVTSGRNLARKVVHDCIVCKKLLGKTLHPLMGNLPKKRLNATYPFLYCGVDYAGPVYTLNRKGRGAKTVKSYICLFICLITRAVHLELVSDLSTDAYILALKRFISRYGKPVEIFSDNGRNFVGAMKEFSNLLNNYSEDILQYAASQSIKFSFIPPYAPHFGAWESGIKSCKHHLTRVIGNAHLTFEEFTTVLAQVAAILNSRPLSPLSSDPNDFLPLSPAHFLIGRTLTAPVYDDMRADPGNLLNRYKKVEQLRHHFWARWAKEYVSELQTRCKWTDHGDSLQAGTLVVIKDDNLPPLKWQLGRIVTTVPGKMAYLVWPIYAQQMAL